MRTLFHHFLKRKIKYFSSTHEENFYIILSKYFQHDEPKNISSLWNCIYYTQHGKLSSLIYHWSKVRDDSISLFLVMIPTCTDMTHFQKYIKLHISLVSDINTVLTCHTQSCPASVQNIPQTVWFTFLVLKFGQWPRRWQGSWVAHFVAKGHTWAGQPKEQYTELTAGKHVKEWIHG